MARPPALLSLALTLAGATAWAQQPDAPTVVTLRLGDTPHPIPGALGEGGERVQIGGRRAELRDGQWRFSDDRFVQEIRAAVALDGRFVFVTEDGLVAASDTFLGPLRPLGAVAGARRASSSTRGRLAILSDDTFVTTDGTSLTPVGPLPAPARHAAFLDAQTGAAVLADGGLVLTRDAGARWTPVDLGRDLALLVAFREGALQVLTTRGVVALSAEGALSPVASRPTARPDGRPAISRENIMAAWRAREPVPDHGETHHRRLPDGTFVAARGALVQHLDAAGRVLSERAFGGNCNASAWRGGVGVSCADLYRTTDGETWEAIPGPPGPFLPMGSGEAVFADDGLGVAVRGQCVGERFEPRAEGICVRDAQGRWRDLRGLFSDPERYRVLRGMRAHDLLVEQHGDDAPLVVVDLDTSTVRPVVFEGVPAGALHVDDAHLTAEGTYAALVRSARGGWYARSREGASWSTLPLPDGAVAVGFADGRRGVAFGEQLGTLWRTLDGGARWDPVPTGVSFSGDPLRVQSRVPVRCDARGCSVGGFVFVRGWGPIQPASERVYGGARRPHPALRNPFSFAALRCAEGAAGPTRRAPASASDATGRFTTLDHVGSLARVGERVTLSWRGEGGRGAVSFPQRADAPISAAVAYSGGALLVTERDLVWAMGASLRPLSLPRLASGASFSRGRWITAPTPGGGLVALSSPARATDTFWGDDLALYPLEVQVAFEVAPNGALLRQRTVVADDVGLHRAAQGLGRVGGRWGHVDLGYDRAVRFTPLDGGPSSQVGVVPEVVRPCGAASGRNANTLLLPAHGAPAGLPEPPAEPQRLLFEATTDGVCLREIVLARRAMQAPAVNEQIVLRAERGALVGAIDDGVSARSLRCEVSP